MAAKRKRRARAEPDPSEELEAALEVYRKACLRVERAGKSQSAARALRVLSRSDLERRADRAAKAELGRRAARRALHLAAEGAALA